MMSAIRSLLREYRTSHEPLDSVENDPMQTWVSLGCRHAAAPESRGGRLIFLKRSRSIRIAQRRYRDSAGAAALDELLHGA
jgi:hypothetical protein